MRHWRLAAGVALAVASIACGRHVAPEPIVTLPEFSLVERDGSNVTLRDLSGSPWIADFVFTRCTLYCPRLTARMKELRSELPATVRTVSFSVDPEHDTPEVLREYAREWKIEGREWLFLTGEKEQVRKLIREGFLLPVEDDPSNAASPVLHSNRFVLVDGRGRIRSMAEAYDDAEMERLVEDLHAILREEEKGGGAGR